MASLKKRLATILAVSVTVGITPTILADDYAYVTADHLNVRSMASVKGYIAAVVDKGYRVTVLEHLSNGWKRVLLENGQEGYLNGKYVADEAPYYEKVGAIRYSVKVGHAFVRSDGLNKKIAVVDKGDELEAVSDRIYFGRWIRVRVLSSANEGYVGRIGYVSKRLVDPIEGYQYAEEVQTVMDDEMVPEELNSAPAEESGDPLADLLGGLEDNSGSDTASEPAQEPAPSDSGSTDDSGEDDILKLLGGLE